MKQEDFFFERLICGLCREKVNNTCNNWKQLSVHRNTLKEIKGISKAMFFILFAV